MSTYIHKRRDIEDQYEISAKQMGGFEYEFLGKLPREMITADKILSNEPTVLSRNDLMKRLNYEESMLSDGLDMIKRIKKRLKMGY